ncbi:TPA: hypothetical protein QC072_002323 [Bacillus cereus]|nr:hypothetical protein [Bacillus cereus]
MKYRWLCFICLLVLFMGMAVGCSKKKELPKGFSEQTYQDFTKIYSDYQEAKKENKQNESSGLLFEYRKKEEQGKLSSEEIHVRETLSELMLIYSNRITKTNNTASDEVKEVIASIAADEYKIPELERTIEKALQLPKSDQTKETSNTSKEKTKDSNTSNEKKKDENTVKEKAKDPNKADQSAELPTAENCPKPYTKEDCEKFTAYYTNGEGKQEPGKNDEKTPKADVSSSDENKGFAADFTTPLDKTSFSDNDRNFVNVVVVNPHFFTIFNNASTKFMETVQTVSQYPRISSDAVPSAVGNKLNLIASQTDMFVQATISQTMGEGKGGNPYSIWLGPSKPNLNPQLQAAAAELRQLLAKLDADCKTIARIYATGQTISNSNIEYITMSAEDMDAYNAALNDFHTDLQNILTFGHNFSVWVKG